MDKSTRLKIREAYKHFKPIERNGICSSPYGLGIDWVNIFSPIEYSVWSDIRYLGVPLYPQYPVGPYFLDFGDPRRKIGIEVDSLKWHKDLSKDMERQKEIEAMGWTIYRIPSRITYKTREDFQDEDGYLVDDAYFTESSEGVLVNIYREFLTWMGQ